MPLLFLPLHRKRLLADPASLGRWGEKQGRRFLRKKGLEILTQNFACRTGEIDLIMVDSDRTIVFVEVKTRTNEDFEPTETVITRSKKTKIARAARYFLAVHSIENRPFRFDVVVIVLGQKGPPQIRHYKNAFTP